MPHDLLMSFIFFLECGPLITCVSNHSLVGGMFSAISWRDRYTPLFAKGKLYNWHSLSHSQPSTFADKLANKSCPETFHLGPLTLISNWKQVCLFVYFVVFEFKTYPQLSAKDDVWLLCWVKWPKVAHCYAVAIQVVKVNKRKQKKPTQDF